MTLHSPATETEACETIASAAAGRIPLAIAGGATKAGIGRPAQSEATLSSRALAGVTLYEPSELVFAARSGTLLADIEAILAASNQALPFEPIDWRPLLGSTGAPTIGGVAATNMSGPRRIMAGAVRDSLIGVRFVNGRGEAIKSGGRVMKNVTGLDLVKLVSGAWGTLGFLTEVTFKVRPRPERTATLVLEALDDTRAVAALATALGSPFEVTGAAHLPAGVGCDRARTLIRVEGFSASVDYRLGELRGLLRSHGAGIVMEDDAGADVWRQVRDATFLAEPSSEAVWRLSTAPTKGPAAVAAIARSRDARWFYDWGGGLVWIAVAADGDAGAAAVRAAVAETGGHATLVRAAAELRATLDVFQPLPEPVMRVTRGIKQALDPHGILEPGRMYAGV